MKNLKPVFWVFALLLLSLTACDRSQLEEAGPKPGTEKDNGRTSTSASENGRIVTEKTTGIQQKAPTVFTLVDPKGPDVMWRVIPETVVINEGTKSTIYFQKAGDFRVFAIDSITLDTSFIDVSVSNEVYTIPNYDQNLHEGEQIFITPTVYGDSTNFLEFELVTSGKYNCTNSRLEVGSNPNWNDINLVIGKVAAGYKCDAGTATAKAIIGAAYKLDINGTGTINILHQGKTYSGSYKKTGLSYEFIWPHNSGVVFTKKSL